MSNVWGRQKPCSVLFCSLYIVRVRVKKTERISMVCPIFPMNLDIGCVYMDAVDEMAIYYRQIIVIYAFLQYYSKVQNSIIRDDYGTYKTPLTNTYRFDFLF